MLERKSRFLACLAVMMVSLSGLAFADQTRTIPNPLGQDWPWELVSMDFDPGAVQPDWVVTIPGSAEPRPIQIEKVQIDGKPKDRVWFLATIGKGQKQAVVRFAPGQAASSLRVTNEGAYTIVDNGVTELRLCLGNIQPAAPLGAQPHWLAGVRPRGTQVWDGRAQFLGTAKVTGLKVEEMARGPVFAQWRLTYEFADSEENGTVEAVPLMLGKQSFRFAPNRIPTETLPRQDCRYEVEIRVVALDPWIEVVERYRLPRDRNIQDWGAHQYILNVGTPTEATRSLPGFGPEGIPVDTVLWTRWFEYDAFGGNNLQLADPARPRATQKGRPFCQLRARWSQAPGGAQDAVFTRGGARPPSLEELLKNIRRQAADIRKAASKDNATADARRTLAEEKSLEATLTAIARQAATDPPAARAAARKLAGDLGLNLPDETAYAADAPAIGVVAAYPSKWVGPYDATITVQAYDGNRGSFRFPLTDGGRNLATGTPQHYGGRCWALLAVPRERLDGRMDDLVRRHSDWTLTALVNHYQLTWPDMGSGKDGPNPSQYLSRRYQADDVNPTNYGNRRMVNDAFWQGKKEDRRIKGPEAFGPLQAAIGYIYTDLDAWPGWHNGWGPGNPNFHTDKYMAAIFAAVAMPSHPHAPQWLAFGRSCFDDDLAMVLTPPDGAGSECPGYAGYSLGLQAEVAKAVLDAGLGNWMADNPLVKKSLTWHRKLLTPFDLRLERRHEAPLGDTHRWDAGANFASYIPFFAVSDPPFAEELRLATQLKTARKPGALGAEQLDWSSQAFNGFGAILRHRFGQPEESFLTLKSGFLTGHYHNDDQSFHWYHRGVPIALDYNCSYHPRGDHAALHNTVTLGRAGTVENNTLKKQVEALEQPSGSAGVVKLVSTPAADLVVADRRIDSLTLTPVDPYDAEFARAYPSRPIQATHRRLLLLTKHPAGSPLSDYLVVRDEIATPEPQQVNLHVLAYDARIDGHTIRMTGQGAQDILIQVVQATDLKVEHRQWHYFDEWLAPPEEYLPRRGETVPAWSERLPNVRPAPDWKPVTVKREQIESNRKRWREVLAETDGLALMPPPGWHAAWTFGECQRWLRFHSRPGTPVMMVIYPYARDRNAAEPVITAQGDSISITAGGQTERITLSSEAGVRINEVELLQPASLPAPGTAIVRKAIPYGPQ